MEVPAGVVTRHWALIRLENKLKQMNSFNFMVKGIGV